MKYCTNPSQWQSLRWNKPPAIFFRWWRHSCRSVLLTSIWRHQLQNAIQPRNPVLAGSRATNKSRRLLQPIHPSYLQMQRQCLSDNAWSDFRVAPDKTLCHHGVRNVSITSLATGGRYDVYNRPKCPIPHLRRPILPVCQVPPSSCRMSTQSNLPNSSEELKCCNLFNVKDFVCVVTGVFTSRVFLG